MAPTSCEPHLPSTPADLVPITEIMTREVVTARVNAPVNSLIRLMLMHHASCVPIVDERGRAIGIVTKSDVLELLDAEESCGDLSMRTAAEVMMPLAITLQDHATVAHVATMMTTEGFHHVMIVGPGGVLKGLVSSHDVVRWIVNNDRSADR
jgi:CBS domain-containing protein